MTKSKRILNVIDYVFIFCALGASIFALSIVVSETYPDFSNKVGHFISGHGTSALKDGYTPIASIPEIYGNNPGSDKVNVVAFITNVFKIGIGLCTALAVLMIIYGGFKYISSEGFGATSDAKDIISHALGGLLLALCIYLILISVNKSLINADFFNDLSKNQATLDISDSRLDPSDPNYPLKPSDPNYGIPVDGTGTPFNGTPGKYSSDNSGTVAGQTQAGTTFPNADWNAYALQQIQQAGLTNLSPSDSQAIFGTDHPTDQDYLHLLASMANKESSFNPKDVTVADVNGVDSVGLLSLSNTDSAARQLGYSEQDLLDPYKNIQTGVQIMKNQLNSVDCVACKNSSGKWVGVSGYWSTVRSSATNNGG